MTEQERADNDIRVAQVIEMCTNGDENAQRYLMDLASCARVMDDIVDEDHSVSRETKYSLYFKLLFSIPNNPFYRQHQDTLKSAEVTALNAWIDANELENRPDMTSKIYAHVIRDYINEICPIVAMLTGGFNKMRECSLSIRDIFKKELEAA